MVFLYLTVQENFLAILSIAEPHQWNTIIREIARFATTHTDNRNREVRIGTLGLIDTSTHGTVVKAVKRKASGNLI